MFWIFIDLLSIYRFIIDLFPSFIFWEGESAGRNLKILDKP